MMKIRLEVEPIGLEADFDLVPGQCLRVGSSDKMEIPLPESGLDSYHLSIERRDDGQVYVEFFGEGQIVRGGEGGDTPILLPAKFEAGGLRFFLEGQNMGQSIPAVPPEQVSQAVSHSVPLPTGNESALAGKKKLPVLALVGVALATLMIGGGGIGWWLNSGGESEQSVDNGEASSDPVSAPMSASGDKQANVIKKEMPPEVSKAEPEKKVEKFQPTKESPATVAVLEFENNSGDEENEPLRKGLRDMMTTDLSQIPVIKVVERARMEGIMEELKLSEGKFIDPATAVKLGKGLAARAVLSGSYAIVGETMRLDTRLVDVETGEILMAEQMTGKKEKFFELQQGLVAKLVAGFDVEEGVTSMVAQLKPQTKNFEAFNSYSRGVYALDQGDEEKAKTEFKAAVVSDGEFRLAKTSLEKIEKEAREALSRIESEIQELSKVSAEDLDAQFKKYRALLNSPPDGDPEQLAAPVIVAFHYGIKGDHKAEKNALLLYSGNLSETFAKFGKAPYAGARHILVREMLKALRHIDYSEFEGLKYRSLITQPSVSYKVSLDGSRGGLMGGKTPRLMMSSATSQASTEKGLEIPNFSFFPGTLMGNCNPSRVWDYVTFDNHPLFGNKDNRKYLLDQLNSGSIEFPHCWALLAVKNEAVEKNRFLVINKVLKAYSDEELKANELWLEGWSAIANVTIQVINSAKSFSKDESTDLIDTLRWVASNSPDLGLKKSANEALLAFIDKQNSTTSSGSVSGKNNNSQVTSPPATSSATKSMPPGSTVRFGSKRSNTPSASTKKANSPPEHSWSDIKNGLSDGTFQSIGSTGFVFKQGNSETKIGIEELQPEALVNLGLMKAAGDRTPKDDTGAFGLFKRAAEMDHPSAAYYLGECLVRGKGTSVQMDVGIIWLKKARAMKYGRASDYLGNLYRDGYPGQKPDLLKARELFKEASDRDVLSGHYNYAVVLINGEGGKKDAPAAVYQFQRAADAGYAPAMKALAQCYEHGIGAKADPAIAAKWKAKLKQAEAGTQSSSSKAAPAEKESSPSARKWRSLGGDVIEGRFQRIERSGLVFKNGGGEIKIPMALLYPEDRKFAEDYLKARN